MNAYQGCYKIVPSPPPSSHEARRQWRKSTGALLCVMCFSFLIVAVAGIQLKDTHVGKIGHNSIRSLGLIEEVCNATLRYELCVLTLFSCPGSLEANMSELARVAVEVSLHKAIRVSDLVVELNKTAGDESRDALEDCAGLLDTTVDQLNSSVSVLAEQDWEQRIEDLRAWLSAALTNPSTCKQGFEDAGVIMDEFMGQMIENLTELVSNDLAIVDFVYGKLSVKLI